MSSDMWNRSIAMQSRSDTRATTTDATRRPVHASTKAANQARKSAAIIGREGTSGPGRVPEAAVTEPAVIEPPPANPDDRG